MAEGFNFEDYYVNETAKTEAVIDRSGVNLQNPTEPAEIVTNNVIYYASALFYRGLDSAESWVPMAETARICVAEVAAPDQKPNYYYLRAWHQLGEVATLGIAETWEPRGDRESTFVVDGAREGVAYYVIDDSVGGTPIQVNAFMAFVYPRHETEANTAIEQRQIISGPTSIIPVNQNPICDPAMMHLLYGALGLYGGRWKGLGWLSKYWDRGKGGSRVAVIPYDRFKRCMDAMATICAEADVGFSVTYYDQTFAKEVTVDDTTAEEYKANRAMATLKHARYRMAMQEADVTRTSMGKGTTFDEAYGTHLPEFIARTGLLDKIDGDAGNVTAVIPPVKKAIASYFYPVDELEDNFSSLFKSVLDALSSVPFVWRFVDGSVKRRISNARNRYGYRPLASPRLAFDMENAMARLTNYVGIGPTYAFRAVPRLIQVGGSQEAYMRGLSYIVGLADTAAGPAISAWNSGLVTGTNILYYGYRGGDDTDENLYNKVYTRMSGADILESMIGFFNAQVDAGVFSESFRLDANAVANSDGTINYDAVPADNPFRNWAISTFLFMNLMRGKGGGSVDETDAVGITMNLLETNLFADGKQYSPNSPTRFWETSYPVSAGYDVQPTGYYDVIQWGECIAPGKEKYEDSDAFSPQYVDEWRDISELPFESFGGALNLVKDMREAYKQMVRATTVQVMTLGALSAARAIMKLSEISDDLDDLDDTCNKLIWYQRLVEESPFTNKSMADIDGRPTLTSSFPARLMFPVLMYKKVKVKYKRWGRTRHKMVKRSIGVRWAEVIFSDTSVFGEYPVVNEEPGETVQFSSEYEVDAGASPVHIILETPLPKSVQDAGRGVLAFTDCRVLVSVVNDVMLVTDDAIPDNPGAIISIRIPLPPSQPDGSKEPVDIVYSMPGLPYDSEIRKRAFVEYGPLSQAAVFEPLRNTDNAEGKRDGWQVFHASSSDIRDLREGLGIHDKVAMLLGVLSHEFGESRVQLVETYRSMEDQEGMCSGGPESAFLSWHNYGLAAHILILKDDGRTPIERSDDNDMRRLVEIARAFTAGCLDGKFGKPCNLVWCGRLAIGANIFDWEFLPIGVQHKDAPLFRDMLISQMDPVHEMGYVDVDGSGYVRRSPPPADDTRPYILERSNALSRAEIHGGHRYVKPDYVRNFPHVSDIVLYDAREFVDLVKLKMNANGTGKPVSGSIYDWKAVNEHACEQLVRYYAMTGGIGSARALLAGDYVERYLPVEEQFFNTSPVDYVKGMLGSHYTDAKICTERDGKSSYITLHDGILHMKSLDAYPNNEPTRFDVHKQQRVDKEHMKWGTWVDGVFYTEDERPVPYIDSERPVIDGYVDGQAVSGEAVMLHQVLALQIHKRFTDIRKTFEEFNGGLMYDHIEDGPNADMADMLENEFGIIKAQDLLSFDELEQVLVGNDPIVENDFGLGRERTSMDGTVYEKVVNNAQISGMRMASLDKEHIHIKDMPTPSDGKTLYDMMVNGRLYMATDLLRR